MKQRIKKVVLLVIVCVNCIFAISPISVLADDNVNTMAEGGEVWESYRIDLYAKAGLEKTYINWGLKAYDNGFKIVPISNLKEWTLDTKTTFKIYDENSNIIFNETYSSGHRMKNIQADLANINLKYNYSFQIIPNKWEKVVRISGYIANNIDNHNYAVGINNSRGSQVRFKLLPTGTLSVEKISNEGLSILNNRFGIQTAAVGLDTKTTNLKFIQIGNTYKLVREVSVPNSLETVKYSFAIAGYTTVDGYLGGQKFYKQIPMGVDMERLDQLLQEIPGFEIGDAIQIIASPTNLIGTPKVFVTGGVINDYDFFDPASGMDNAKSSVTAFHLTESGLKLDPMIMK